MTTTPTMFPPVYLINLERSTHRRELMDKNLKELDISYTVFHAIDGSKLSSDDRSLYSPLKTIEIHGRELSAGELGAALSHLKIYELMVASGIVEAVILEDDIHVGEMFCRLVKMRDKLPPDWDIFSFSDSEYFAPFGSPVTDIYRFCRNTEPVNGSYAYIVTLNGARKLLKHAYPIRFCPDGLTGRTAMTGVVMYGVRPSVVSLRDVKSDIWEISTRPAKVTTVKKIVLAALGKITKYIS